MNDNLDQNRPGSSAIEGFVDALCWLAIAYGFIGAFLVWGGVITSIPFTGEFLTFDDVAGARTVVAFFSVLLAGVAYSAFWVVPPLVILRIKFEIKEHRRKSSYFAEGSLKANHEHAQSRSEN